MVAKSEHTVVHVPRLVLNHHLEELLEHRLLGHLIERSEGAERQALDHDLHAEELHVPARVLNQRVDDDEQVVVDLVELVELRIEVAMEHLDVAAFVDNLRRAVELAIEELHGLRHLSCREKRALLPVKELTQHPRRLARVEAALLELRQSDAGSSQGVEVHELVRKDRFLGALRIDVDVPGKVVPVPLLLLGAVV